MTKKELDSWTRSTSKDVYEWFAAQKPKQVANMAVIEHDIQEALHSYGRVSNIEMESCLDDVTTIMRVEFDVTCGLFSIAMIRDALSKIPWIYRVVNCGYIVSTKHLSITIELDAFAPDCLERRKEAMEYTKYEPMRYPKYYPNAVEAFVPQIDRVTFNGPATIVFWTDGTKTIVKCMEDEEFDPEKGLAMAICKRLYGGKFHKTFKDAIKNAKW